jgi:hypothetical protein
VHDQTQGCGCQGFFWGHRLKVLVSFWKGAGAGLVGVGGIVFVKKDSVSGNVACSHSHGHSFVATTFVARSLGRSGVCGLRCFLVSPLSLAKQNFLVPTHSSESSLRPY